jgi:Ca2+-binding RTX toxin-like protein
MLGESSPGLNLSGGGTLQGSQYDDLATATAGSATLLGGAGRDQLAAAADGGVLGLTFEGGKGNDVLRATVDNGVFAVEMTGGRGNDTLYGSYAGDTYVFNPGDGDDLVIDDVRSLGSQGVNDYFQAHPEDTAYHDHLLFGAGIDPQDVSYARWGNDMLFTVAGGGSVTVQNWFDGTPFSRIEKIDFASGAPSWNGSQLTAA